MKTLKQRVTRTLVLVATGLVVHAVLLNVLVGQNVVAAALSAGAHSSWPTLLLVGAFLVVRVMVVLVLPGAILCRCVLWAVEFWRARQR